MQTPAPFEYERATSVDAAIASLVKHDGEARIIAGGHSLLPMMKLRLANPEHLIDINDLEDLAYIRHEDGEIRIAGVDPDLTLPAGSEIEAAVATENLHFFDDLEKTR